MGNKRVLIDTSILIEYLRKNDKSKSVLFHLSEKYEIFISTITEFELLVGYKDDKMDFANQFLENISILSFDSKSVFESRKIYLDLKNRNKLIELPDIFIAGTAIANDLPVSTLNLKHFERIEGLEIIK